MIGEMNLYSHKPEGYECPFCRVVSGIERPNKGTKQRDIIYRNKHVTAFIASKWWPNNKGHALVVPNEHFENIYELPAEMAAVNSSCCPIDSVCYEKHLWM